MKITLASKGYNPSDRLEDAIEKKFEKLSRYFRDDVTCNILISKFKDKLKVEATIIIKEGIFRAEGISANIYEAIDGVVDKLGRQMSKFKGKLEKRYKENKALKFEFIPTSDEEEKETGKILKRKKFNLKPMNEDEAVLQMEMTGHDFFIYLDADTDSINVVYKRNEDSYGIIETVV